MEPIERQEPPEPSPIAEDASHAEIEPAPADEIPTDTEAEPGPGIDASPETAPEANADQSLVSFFDFLWKLVDIWSPDTRE